jgi:predicted RNase H-like HicB family nuclease
MERLEYFALVHKDPGSAYGVVFPDLPGCTSAGGTLDEARANAVEALALHVAGLREDDADVPTPTSLEAAWASEDAEGALLAFPVPLTPLAGRAVRLNITLDAGLLAAIDTVAGRRRRSAFLARGARRLLADATED